MDTVTFYQHINLGGTSKKLSVGNHNFTTIPEIKEFSSMEITGNHIVTLTHENNTTITIDSSIFDFRNIQGTNWNDAVVNINIENKTENKSDILPVKLYQHTLYGGTNIELGIGTYDSSNKPLISESSSLEITGDYKVTFRFSDGNTLTFDKSVDDFTKHKSISNINLNDNVTSVIVEYNDIYTKVRDGIVSIFAYKDINSAWTGSGFFIKNQDDNKYYIVTVAHNVIEDDRDEDNVKIYASISNLNNKGQNKLLKCKKIGVGALADIAVLELDNDNILENQSYLEWGDSVNTSPGSECYIIGDPLGVDAISASKGVVRDNKFIYESSIELLSTDLHAHPGHSGSPILNKDGKIIGMLAHTLVDEKTINSGPAEKILREVVNKIITSKKNFIGKTLDANLLLINAGLLYQLNKYQINNNISLSYLENSNLEGYYVSNNNTNGLKNGNIITHYIQDGIEYTLGVYAYQYPLSRFIYVNNSSSVQVRVKDSINSSTSNKKTIQLNDLTNDKDHFNNDIIRYNKFIDNLSSPT